MLTLTTIKDIASSCSVPPEKELASRASLCLKVLKNEGSYRPKAKSGVGGLLDFTDCDIPVIVVPDLHARAFFLNNLMNFNLKGVLGIDSTVFDALSCEKVIVVCVGDILHSEARGYERWLIALNEMVSGDFSGPAMSLEMAEGLATQALVMELKSAFPKSFHVLRGNHENILNENKDGNWGFYKFVREGEMVERFMRNTYKSKTIKLISEFEKALPLVAAFKNCVISHGEPLHNFTRQQIIDAPSVDEDVRAFTWTRNKQAEQGSVAAILQELTGNKDARYIGGHRPVVDNYETWQDGLYIQIHNPDKQNIAIVRVGATFNPDTDIITISESAQIA